MATYRVTTADGKVFEVTLPEEGSPTAQDVTPGPLERFSESAIGTVANLGGLAQGLGQGLAETGADFGTLDPSALMQRATEMGITDPAALTRGDLASTLGRAAPFAAAGLAGAPTPVLAGVESLSNLGGAFGEFAGRAVGGDVGALAGGLAGSLAPAGLAGGLKRTLGTQQGARSAQALSAATGAPIGLPEVGGSGLARFIERATTKIPGGAQVAQRRATRIALQLRGRLDDLTTRLARSPNVTPETGGRAIRRGFEGFVEGFKRRTNSLYDDLRTQLQATSTEPVNYRRALRELQSQELGDATAISRGFNPDTAGLVEDSITRFQQTVAETGGSLTGSQLDAIRRRIGNELGSVDVIGTPREGVLSKLYSAVTEDLRLSAFKADQVARQAGTKPTALRAFERASSTWRAGRQRIQSLQRELLNRATDSKVLAALETSARSGPETVRTLRRSVSPEHWEVAMGSVLKRLGQNARGEFTFSTLAGNIGKLEKNGAYREMFKQGPLQLRGVGEDLAQIAKVARGSEDLLKILDNPSGTAMAGLTGAGTFATLGGAGAAFTGFLPEYLGIVGMMGAGVAGSAGLNAMIASPQTLRWVAQSTAIPVSQLPAHIDRLGKLAENDPQARELLTSIRESMN